MYTCKSLRYELIIYISYGRAIVVVAIFRTNNLGDDVLLLDMHFFSLFCHSRCLALFSSLLLNLRKFIVQMYMWLGPSEQNRELNELVIKLCATHRTYVLHSNDLMLLCVRACSVHFHIELHQNEKCTVAIVFFCIFLLNFL